MDIRDTRSVQSLLLWIVGIKASLLAGGRRQGRSSLFTDGDLKVRLYPEERMSVHGAFRSIVCVATLTARFYIFNMEFFLLIRSYTPVVHIGLRLYSSILPSMERKIQLWPVFQLSISFDFYRVPVLWPLVILVERCQWLVLSLSICMV